MAEELAAVWFNPYTLEKSRTGGVLARLLSLTQCELVAARMFSPRRELVERYCRLIVPRGSPGDKKIREQIRGYLTEHWITRPGARDHPRVLMLLFKGEEAIDHMRHQVVGPITRGSISGETVRDTYGDYIEDSRGRISYFEPAVFIISESSSAEKILKLWASYSDSDGGVLKHSCCFSPPVKPETTLVMLKPANFQGPSSLAGNVIDIICRTGLRIIGAKIIRMSIAQAQQFYEPVERSLPQRMKRGLMGQVDGILRESFDFPVPSAVVEELADKLKYLAARAEFDQILKTMTGLDPGQVTQERDRRKPGREKCLALIYQGDRAISRIRSVLGATDPTKAKWATIRRIYGHSINDNVAHASDSRRNYLRETRIIEMGKNDFKNVIRNFYREKT